MKKYVYQLIVLSLLLVSCNQLDFDEQIKPAFQTKSETKFNVSLKNVNTLMGILDKNDSRKIIDNVEPIIYIGDTLLYIVNYKNNSGWKIISGDKRTSSVLASETTGSFKIKDLKPGVITWIDDLSEHIYAIKQYGKPDTTGTDYQLWSNIEKYQNYKDRVSGKNKIVAPPVEEGYWELIYITSDSLPSVQVGPLLQTKWGQGDPWYYCVPDYYNTTTKCATGCVAVAGSQMMYFLHYKIGVPATSYESGSCDGYSVNDQGIWNSKAYNFTFSNATSTVWDNMARNENDYFKSTDYVGILMGNVGNSVNMDYGTSSGADPRDLVTYFNNIGINCNYKNYNSTEMFSSLQNKMPVILSAYRIEDYFLGIFPNTKSHTWLADGYETKNTKYTYYYEWVSTSGGSPGPYMSIPSSKSASNLETKTTYTISSTTYLIMNWGYEGMHDEGRYLFDGDWTPVPERNYLYFRKMINGFSKK